MTTAQRLKQKLLVEIEKLPEYRLQEVLDFVSFLLSQKSRYSPGYQEQGKDLDPEKNPILQFIGGVSHGSLAQGIDEELYGAYEALDTWGWRGSRRGAGEGTSH